MEKVLPKVRKFNKKLEDAGYDKINIGRAEHKEQLGVLVLQKLNQVMDNMELTISNIDNFEDADEITEDTYIVEDGIDIAEDCLLD